MAINEVIFGGQTLMSLKGDTVTPADLAEGVTAHDASGNVIVGTAVRGLPVGFEYLQTNPNIQAGSLPMVGGLWNREIYADLWAWVQTQPGYLISEEEWQALASANNGAVPFYSIGDGSTNFRVPALTVWVKGTSNVEEVGDYLADSFKSHKHNVSVSLSDAGEHKHTIDSSGAHNHMVYTDKNFCAVHTGNNNSWKQMLVNVDGNMAVNCNYTNSAGSHSHTMQTGGSHTHTVTLSETTQGNEETRPKTIVGVYCVVAYGFVTRSGEVSLNSVQQVINNATEVIRTADMNSYVKKEEISSLIDFYTVVGATTERDSSLPTYGLE